MSDNHPDLNATEARQGRRGMHVLWILVISLALVTVAFAVIWLSNAGPLSDKHGAKEAQPSAAATFNAPEPAARQDNAGTPTGDVLGPSAAPSPSN
jgi:flagellar basal body-associated protein FliL